MDPKDILKGLGDMGGGLGDLLQQAQGLQAKMAERQEAARTKTVEASAGGGMVTAVVSGGLEVVELRVDPSVLADGDAEMLQDLVIAAVNEGLRRSKEMIAAEMAQVTGGLQIPGLG